MSPSAALWSNIWRATVIYQRCSVNLLHLLVLRLLVHFFAVTLENRHRILAVSLPRCISEIEKLGFLRLSAFPFSNLFIHPHQIYLPSSNPSSSFSHSLFLICKGWFECLTLFLFILHHGILVVDPKVCLWFAVLAGCDVLWHPGSSFLYPPALPPAVTGSDLSNCAKNLESVWIMSSGPFIIK